MRIVLAYSGGLSTTAAIPWLKARHRADVIAVIADLGQGRALEAIRDRALAAGAVRAHVVDAREAFARTFVLPSLRAQAVRDDGLPQPEALGRSMVGQVLVEIARIERAVAAAHGCEPDDLDRSRIESAVCALDPNLAILRPAAEWDMSRAQVVEYAREQHLPVSAGADAGWRVDVNLWGRTIRPLDPSMHIPDAAFMQTTGVRSNSREPASVELSFEDGAPTGINGVAMPLLELIQTLGAIAGAHGIGRASAADVQVEAPAAVVLHAAHRALDMDRSSPDLQTFNRTVSRAYGDLVHHGGWFSALRDGLDAFVARTQQRLDGVVRLSLVDAECRAVDVQSLNP